MPKILEIASQISTPLALAGFFAGVLFLVLRQIIAKNLFPRFTAAVGGKLVRLMIDRLFVLALVAMVLGFVAYVLPVAFGAGHSDPAAADEYRSPPAQFSAVSGVARSQLDSRDYAGAWTSVGAALKSEPARADLLELQADIAMAWLRDVHLREGQKFTDVADELLPVLYQTAQRHRADDHRRAADALAHVGWGNFLKDRDGAPVLDVEGKYREAVALDPDNVFAHAMWGHAAMTHGGRLAEALTHFTAALKGGRERPFVRVMQLAALQWTHADENAIELVRVCNDMRRSGEPPPDADRRIRVLRDVYDTRNPAVFTASTGRLPPDEHLATFRWLRQGLEGSASPRMTFAFARLTEEGGDRDAALRLYVSLLHDRRMAPEVQAAIARCRTAAPASKSDVELLAEMLADPAPEVRSNAVDCLAELVAGGGGNVTVDSIVPALRDPQESVRASAVAGIASAGRAAVPSMIGLLAGADAAGRISAAEVLAEIGPSAKAAVPALIQALEGPDATARTAYVCALGGIGRDAADAVPVLARLLAGEPREDARTALIFTLGEIGPAAAPAVPSVVLALKERGDRAADLRFLAADALGKIGPAAASAVPALVEALGSEDVRLPTSATVALGSIGAEAKSAVPALVAAMRSAEPEHRRNQADAIAQIARALAVRKDTASLEVLRAALLAEQEVDLPLAAIAPLSEAIDVLRK